jgi:hypothetical protein
MASVEASLDASAVVSRSSGVRCCSPRGANSMRVLAGGLAVQEVGRRG